MPATGRKPKPPGQAVNRHKPTHDWTEVEDVPFDIAEELPRKSPRGLPWPAATRRWWSAVSTMPHCRLWAPSDWQFALDTAAVAAEFHAGDMRVATELRNREKVLGTTVDFRRDLRIRYVDPAPDVEAQVTRLADYRDL